jgi:hypothetical protein
MADIAILATKISLLSKNLVQCGCNYHADRDTSSDFKKGMPHALTKMLMIRNPSHQLVNRDRMLANLATQTVRIQHHNEGQSNRQPEGWVTNTFLQSDERGHTANNSAMIAGQATIANQAKGQLSGLDPVDRELYDPSDKPGHERRKCI